MSQMIRSFIAFDLDDKLVLRRLSEVQDRILETGADVKLVKPQNIHITMRFLGDISSSMADLVYEGMKNIHFPPFEVEIRGLGAFPRITRARVLWAEIQKGANELRKIFHELEPHLQQVGFPPDNKGFTPHLTIARVRTRKNKAELYTCIKNLQNYEFGFITADRLRLKRSLLTPRGPVYSTIHEVGAIKVNPSR